MKTLYIINILVILTNLILKIIDVFVYGNTNYFSLISWLVIFILFVFYYYKEQKQSEKLKTVNVEEIKDLLNHGKKTEAIKKIVTDKKCSLISAIFYVDNLEKNK